MTQPVLFAVEDGEHSAVTEDAAIVSTDNNSVIKGAIVEKRFEIAAMERGYEVAANTGGGKDFDYIVRLIGGTPVVVQVKTGKWREKHSFYNIKNCTNGGVYSKGAYDVLAVYLPIHQQWLFYLRAELGNRTETSYTPPELRKRLRKTYCGMHGETMADREPDNWDLLHQVAAPDSQKSLGLPPPMSDPLLQNLPIP
jgi:hypothetical protein